MIVLKPTLAEDSNHYGASAGHRQEAAAMQLHPTVECELECVAVYATVALRRSSSSSDGPSGWVLRLFEVRHSSQDEANDWAARRLAVRDALVYCAVQLGMPVRSKRSLLQLCGLV